MAVGRGICAAARRTRTLLMDPAELRPAPILLILLILSLLTYVSAPADKSSRSQGYAARRLPPAMTVSNLRKVRNSATPQLHIPPLFRSHLVSGRLLRRSMGPRWRG